MLAPASASRLGRLDGQQLHHFGALDRHIDKPGMDQVNLLHPSGQKGAHDLPGHRHRIGKVELIPHIHVLGQHLPFAPPEEIPAFAAHADEGNLDTRGLFFPDELHRGVDQVDVEAAAQTPVSGHQHHTDPFHRGSRLEEGVDLRFYPAGHIAQHHGEGPGIRPEPFHAQLGAPQFRRRDHVHGLGDLLGLLDRPDFAFDIL